MEGHLVVTADLLPAILTTMVKRIIYLGFMGALSGHFCNSFF
jgi:hypothetical protein